MVRVTTTRLESYHCCIIRNGKGRPSLALLAGSRSKTQTNPSSGLTTEYVPLVSISIRLELIGSESGTATLIWFARWMELFSVATKRLVPFSK